MADGTRNAINWFQIPSSDYGRATRFYESILGALCIECRWGTRKWRSYLRMRARLVK